METESGNSDFATIKLNDKQFGLLEVWATETGPFPFTQYLIFDDYRFQLYSIPSTTHATTSYSYYFRREGESFYLLSSEAIPILKYDYNAIEKKENERFFGMEGYGRGLWMKVNYKLKGNRINRDRKRTSRIEGFSKMRKINNKRKNYV